MPSPSTNKPAPKSKPASPQGDKAGGVPKHTPNPSATPKPLARPEVGAALATFSTEGAPSEPTVKVDTIEAFAADDTSDEEEEDGEGHVDHSDQHLLMAGALDPQHHDAEVESLRQQYSLLQASNKEPLLTTALSAVSSWVTEYPDDTLGRSDVRIEHRFQTRNRLLEASLGTDVCPLDSSCWSAITATEDIHTRVFEAVGHYAPNLVKLVGSEPMRLIPPEWVPLTGRESAFRLTDGRAQPAKGWVRYRLLNGKYAEMRSKKETPPFVVFPALEALSGFTTYAIRSTVREEEISRCTIAELASPSALFDEAVVRGGGVEQVKLLPYFRPRATNLPESVFIREWLRASAAPEVSILPPPQLDARAALLLTVNTLSAAGLGSEGEQALEELKKLVHPEMDLGLAERIYEYTKQNLSTSPNVTVEAPARTQFYAQPNDDIEEAGTRPELIEFYVSGEPCTVLADIAVDVEYDFPYPSFPAPERASKSAINVLSYFPALSSRIIVGNATFVEDFPWYALSATPRKQLEERGILSDGYTWFERMNAHVDYDGPVFLPRDVEDVQARYWASAFNTTWLEENLFLGGARRLPRVYLWKGSSPPPQFPLPPATARGIGVVEGQLVLSPLVETREDWEQYALQDSRLLFPLEVLRGVLNHPNIFQVVQLDEYLSLHTPLRLRATVSGEEYESFFYPGMTLNHQAETAKDAFRWIIAPQSVDESEGGAALPPRIVPPRNKKVAETDDTEWGIPDDETAPGWQLKAVGVKKPHSAITAYGDKFVISKIGNWDSVGSQLSKAGLTEELIKQLYSVHWQAANSLRKHPVVSFHHPSWTDSLKGKPVNRRRWCWPRSAIAPCPWLSTNDAGQMPLFGMDAEQHLRKLRQKESRASWYESHAEESVVSQPKAAPRHVPRRGRGGGAVTQAPSRPTLSAEQAPPPDANWW